MTTHKELLELSCDSWQQSATFSKIEAVKDLAEIALGSTVAGIGIGFLLRGEGLISLVPVAVGGVIAGLGVKEALDDAQAFADATAQATIAQNRLNKLTES